MSALTPHEKERLRRARSRAGHIRYGMQTIGDTFEHIARARAEGDHLTLGYDTWAEYVDSEFGVERVKLPADKRNAYIEMLALAGASQREIAGTVGVSQPTVQRVLARGDSNESPEEGEETPSPARSRIVEAMTGAIEDAEERAQDHRDAPSPGAGFSDPTGAEAATSAPPQDHRDERPGDEADVPVQASAADPGSDPPLSDPGSPSLPAPIGEEASGSAAAGESAAGPGCEKCGGPIRRDDWVGGFMRCNDCDPHGAHIANGDGCAVCVPPTFSSSCPTCGQPLPT